MQTIKGINVEQYWLNRFSGDIEGYDLPWEAEPQTRQSASITVPKNVSKEIIRVCKAEELTILSYFSAAFALILQRYLCREDIIFCAGIRSILIPLRFHMDDQSSYLSLLEQTGNQMAEGAGLGEYSFEQFVRTLAIRNNCLPGDVFNKVLLAYNSFSAPAGCPSPDLRILISNEQDIFKLDIEFEASPEKRAIIDFFFESYLNLLENVKEVLQSPLKTINLLSARQQQQILALNPPAVQSPPAFLDEFAYSVKVSPHKVALIHQSEQLTYQMLDELSGLLAGELHRRAVKSENIVAVLLGRSPDLVIALLAVLRSGGAFLPIDPEYPEDRIAYILKDSKATYVISSRQFQDKLKGTMSPIYIEDIPDESKPYSFTDVCGEDLAYVIYTSGTTGQPNGVMIEHHSLANLCQWHRRFYQMSADDITTKYAGQGFDATVWEIFPALAAGAGLYIVEDDVRYDIAGLNERFIRHGVTISFLPTQIGEQFMTLENTVLKKLLLGGDKLRLINEMRSYQVYNNYGPTENTVVSTAGLVTSNVHNITIGRPIDNTRIFIINAAYGQLAPLGGIGEICISGESLARGYWDNQELTARKFGPGLIDQNERLYKTGDVGRWLPGGDIEFLGRADNQVKIRGYRIELEEIEKNLLKYFSIKDAVVVKKTDSKEISYLCAYYTSSEYVEADQLASFLKEMLPWYMIPPLFIRLESIPATANGKVDRTYLSGKEEVFHANAGPYQAPQNGTEKIVQKVWQDVLEVSVIGTEDNFFVLGGDSIKAIQIESRLLTAGYSMDNFSLFDYPTIRKLSQQVKPSNQSAFQGYVTGRIPMSPIQASFFNNTGNISKAHFNQAVLLEFNEALKPVDVVGIFHKLQAHHDALRIIFRAEDGTVIQENEDDKHRLDLTILEIGDEDETDDFILEHCELAQRSVQINHSLLKLILFQLPSASKIAVIIHHLVIDGVSWRILLEDIESLFQQTIKSVNQPLPAKTDSFKVFAEKLTGYTPRFNERLYWKQIKAQTKPELLLPNKNVPARTGDLLSLDIVLSEKETDLLLHRANGAYNTGINHLLISGLVIAASETFHRNELLIWMEGHGRDKLFKDLDISRTVGWFTSIYPLIIHIKDLDIGDVITEVKDTINRVPGNGIGYGIMNNNDGLWETEYKEITFNYLGQFDSDLKGKSFTVSNNLTGSPISPNNTPESEIEITGMIRGSCLQLWVKFNPGRLLPTEMDQFVKNFHHALCGIIKHCADIWIPVITPSDFTYKHLDTGTLRELTNQYDLADILPLSPTQAGMLFHHILEKHSLNHFQKFKYELAGSFHQERLFQTLKVLFERNDILRTIFCYEDLTEPLQLVVKEVKPDFHFIDLSAARTGQEVCTIIESYNVDDRLRGFNLAEGKLLRLCVIELPGQQFQFIWTFHHIIIDGWAAALLCAEFHQLYHLSAGRANTALPRRKSYSGYLTWLMSRDGEQSRLFWTEYLKELKAITPTSPDSHHNIAYQPAELLAIMDEITTKGLQSLSAQNQVTTGTILECAWSILLGRYNCTNEVVFGKIVSGRSAEIEGIEQMIGPFINTIPVFIKPGDDETFAELAQRVQCSAAACEKHAYCSLADIQKLSGFGEHLFDHIFAFENYPVSNNSSLLDIPWKNIEVVEQTRYNLNVVVIPGSTFRIIFKYNAAVFEADYISGIRDSFLKIIDQVRQNFSVKLGDLEIVTTAEKEKILYAFNRPDPYHAEKTFLELFSQKVSYRPHAIALTHKHNQLTYLELDRRSDIIASALTGRGVGRNDVAAIMLNRSVEMITGLLAILKTGAAFVPIDPEYPEDRIDYIITNSEAKVLITEHLYTPKLKTQGEIIYIETFEDITEYTPYGEICHDLNTLAYIIYTSGTTGLPNGVMIDQRALAGLCEWHKRFYGISPDDISTKYAGLGFDATIWEIFPVLISGGSLYIVEEELKYDVCGLNESYLKHGVTISFLPTSIGEMFMAYENKILKKLLVGGDKLKVINERATYAIYNNYGPTENSVVTTAGVVTENSRNIPIGKPIDTTNVFILSGKTLQLQPVGVPGELCISGDGLAKGYFANELLTSQKFVDNPFASGKRLYRTGDLARWQHDGTITFLERLDHQVSIRGFRIELGEIETRLLEHEMIQDCVIIVDKNNNGHQILYAFYTAQRKVPAEELKLFLLKSLPFYMLPNFFIRRDFLPINQNGKIDRAALKELCKNDERALLPDQTINQVELDIIEIWRTVLRVDAISKSDNFFDLGGTSLDMMLVSGKLSKLYPVENLLMQMFIYPTVSLLAASLGNTNRQPSTKGNRRDDDKVSITVKNNRANQRLKRRG